MRVGGHLRLSSTGRQRPPLGIGGSVLLPALAIASLLLGADATSRSPELPPKGLTYGQVHLPGGPSGHRLRVDLSQARLQMLDARDHGQPALSAREFAERTGATAVFNASFFDVDGSPMGLLVVDGEERAKLRPVDWGVFALRGKEASIVHTRDWKGSKGVQQAFQVGPRLVVGGEVVPLKRQAARRTALCILRSGGLEVMVVGSPVLASEFASFLQAEGCVDALNLDGGPSSQLYVSRAGIVVDEPGGSPVPVAVGLFVEGSAEIAPSPGCGGCG